MVSGSTTVLPIVSKAADLFKVKYPKVMIIVNARGSGVGINQVGEKTVTIGMISRDIIEEEQKKFPESAFVTHNIEQAKRISDNIISLCEGKVTAEGSKNKIFSSPIHQQTREYITMNYCEC